MKTLLALFLIFFSSLSLTNARTVTIAKEHFSFDLPDSWIETPKDEILYSAKDESQTGSGILKLSAIDILKFPNSENHVIDAEYIKGVKEGMSAQASKIGATVEFPGEGPITINGVPTYLVQSKMTLPNATVLYQRVYPIAANDNIYLLTLNSVDPNQDSVLQGIANSFKFDSSPTLPDPMRNALSYKIGEVVGTLLFLLAGYYFIRWVSKLGSRR
jgi:hypothetical protein